MPPERPRRAGAAALMVAAGIFLSRIAGFVRSRALAHYLGSSDAADAFTYALKLPNLLQNLFGEGVLSASFIPVYARLLEEKREEEARRVAGAVFTALSFAMALLVLGGVLAAPVLVDVFAAGYAGEKREVCIRLVRILFPGTGLLVLSAWCLGVLNSHRRFFLSYAAPVLWNLAIIAALVFEGGRTGRVYSLAEAAAWGAVAGSALQLLVQLPAVLILLGGLRLGLARASGEARQVGRSFLPVVLGRGVVQISSWIDTFVASFLSTGAMAGLGYAQMLYLLPISLFGMAISASELPEMARASGDRAELLARLRPRLEGGLRRLSFFVLGSAIAFVALGDMVVALVYRTGRFGADDTRFVWAILAAFSLGLYAATQSRLYSSALYALRDASAPFRVAIVRVAVGAALGGGLSYAAVVFLGVERRWAVVGLALASGLAAWLELALLRRALSRRLGERIVLPARMPAALFLAGALAAGAGWGAKLGLARTAPGLHPAAASAVVLGVFGVVYLVAALALGNPDARGLLQRIVGRLRRRRG
jgi:putative peptidoglycan lipid II flippase